MPKIKKFSNNVAICVYDVIIIIESWLNDQISDVELALHNSNIFRADRSIKTSAKPTVVFDFGNGDYCPLNNFLTSVDWTTCFNELNLDEKVSLFYDILFDCLDHCVPKKTIKINKHYPRWFNNDLRNLCQQKKLAHSKYKKSGQLEDYVYFKTVNATMTCDPKYFWKFMRDNNKDSGIPNYMSFENKSADNGFDISNFFAACFSFVYVISSTVNFDCVDNGLKVTISDESLFPDLWKNCYVTPIFQSGVKTKVENYRGVCNQLVIPKILDEIVSVQLQWMSSSIICAQQHGFTKGKSSLSNLLIYYSFINKSFQDKIPVDSIYTDFAKVFDRVNHSVLISKLMHLGFILDTIKWLHCFLSDRYQQQVKTGNFISQTFGVISGVPQGSHCGPILFILFINEL
ncbi:uncharacterized protein LOC135137335 [Zophobas morio]|uniref:uncharacterized protein LOC135137335 n=1 Tax=Zophobas morio TaxID=2755281 RepID=UPI003083E510